MIVQQEMIEILCDDSTCCKEACNKKSILHECLCFIEFIERVEKKR